jgi:hypothetical protein
VKTKGRCITIVAGIAAAGVLIVSLWTCWDEIFAWYRYQTVRKLLEPGEREAALRKIHGWGIDQGQTRTFMGDPDLRTIDDVVICFQLRGRPLFTVIFDNEPPGDSFRSFELIDSDGTFLDFHLDSFKGDLFKFKDINGDGIVEFVDAFGHELDAIGARSVTMLYVIPVLRTRYTALMVAFSREKSNPRPIVGATEDWSWELRPTGMPGAPFDIVLGPRTWRPGGRLEPKAVYTWSAERKEYVGPDGGYDQPFLRIREEEEGKLKETLEHFWRS